MKSTTTPNLLLLLPTLLGLPLTSCADTEPTSVEQVAFVPPTSLGMSMAWLQENANPLSSLDSGDYSDLQFLKPLIGESRIVQLGESGHGVAEFSTAKVRLIKFLHEEMGFDVIAFESSLYECFQADREADVLSPTRLMTDCIYQVWHTREVLPLFEYIKETRTGDQPLRLAGFDMKPSNPYAYRGRLDFITEVVGRLDPALASEVEGWEAALIASNPPYNVVSRLGEDFDVLYRNYADLLAWFDAHEKELVGLFPNDPETPLVARQVIWTTLNLLDFSQVYGGFGCEGTEVRDHGMAVNLSFLVERLFPGKKIIVWAHNYHIRYDNVNTRNSDGSYGCRTMGAGVARRLRARDGTYTVGLYMGEGNAALNDRQVYTIRPADPNSLEGFLSEAGEPHLFLDLLHQDFHTAPTWLNSQVLTRSWGTGRVFMIPSHQYDGLLYIRQVNSPDYIQGG